MNKQDSKNSFLRNFDFIANPYMLGGCLGISPKRLILGNAPDPTIDLHAISFLCTNFETLTVFSAIVIVYCT